MITEIKVMCIQGALCHHDFWPTFSLNGQMAAGTENSMREFPVLTNLFCSGKDTRNNEVYQQGSDGARRVG